MKLIVAGSRTVTNPLYVEDAMRGCSWWPQVSEVVHGGCRGVDELAGRAAAALGVPVRVFAADWSTYGKAAGPVRNSAMAEYADALLAVWDGKSRGTADMIEAMRRLGKPVQVVRVE